MGIWGLGQRSLHHLDTMNDKEQADKIEMTRLATYGGLGRNPNSNIKEAEGYRGLGRNPNSNLGTAPADRPLQRNTQITEETPKPITPFAQKAETSDDIETSNALYCPFGSIADVPGTSPVDKVILGGVVHCGETNYTVADYPIDIETALDTLLWHKVDFNAATDDDEQVMLPGIALATGITEWASGAAYPDASLPTSPAAPAASVIVPIGRLKVTIPDGEEIGTAVFYRAACGNVTITHCPGSVGYTRGV